MKELFRGNLVRLNADEPDVYAKADARWQRDSEFVRLAGGDQALFSEKKFKEWAEKKVEKGPQSDRCSFSIHTLDNDRMIGYLDLSMNPIHSEVWVGIGIGERDAWNNGYGTDAMKLCLRYAFLELGARRVSLGLHEYNSRALRSYEKAGFQMEGRTRKEVNREGKRTDVLWMGILREEWFALQNGE